MIQKIPQVILLGNGINRAFGGTSWNGFLQAIANEEYKKELDKLHCPMPLKAILVTGDNIKENLNTYIKTNREEVFGKVERKEHVEMLQNILSIGADHILTTNYSYELEIAALGDRESISKYVLKNMISHTKYVEKAEQQYLLSSFNRVTSNGVFNRIWHIHGEARKPDSVILGHYYYGELLYRLKDYIKQKGSRYLWCQRNEKEWHVNSWVDVFLMGDVYFLGSRLDLSEIDLWWLINRKKRESAEHGRLYFYEPQFEPDEEGRLDERLELIKVFADVNDMGVIVPKRNDTNPSVRAERDNAFREFYQRAVKDICQKIMAVNSSFTAHKYCL